MTALYIDRRDAHLDYSGGQLRIHEPDRAPRGFPLATLDRVVIRGNATIETRLLTHLAEQGTSILLIGGRSGSRHAHVHGFQHGDAARRLGQYRLATDPVHRLRWARLLVRGRARGAMQLLRDALELRADSRLELMAGIRQISARLQGLRGVDVLDSLRGVEGAIGAAYFAALTALFAPSLEFHNRNRRPPKDPVNAALSLGYTLSHADAVRAVLIAGLDPLIGVYHETENGRESLACDLNELARPIVERLVWRLFADRRLRPESFEAHAGGVFLKKDARQIFYAAFEQNAPEYRRRLRTASSALARHCVRLAAQARQP